LFAAQARIQNADIHKPIANFHLTGFDPPGSGYLDPDGLVIASDLFSHKSEKGD
jgi:hypothetical protein